MATYSFKVRIPKNIDWILVAVLLLARRMWYGYAFRRIPLTKGKYAIVDAEDFLFLNQQKWYAHIAWGTYYAMYSRGSDGKKRQFYMHRVVMAKANPKYEILNPNDGNSKKRRNVGMVVDHINGNGLDNRKANLRVVTMGQNRWNRRKIRGGSSKYKGVDWYVPKGKWRARISTEKKVIHLGYFATEVEAARAYDAAARKYHGSFASPNFGR